MWLHNDKKSFTQCDEIQYDVTKHHHDVKQFQFLSIMLVVTTKCEGLHNDKKFDVGKKGGY